MKMTNEITQSEKFSDAKDALKCIEKLRIEGKWAISATVDPADNTITIQWEPQKYYTAQDGKEYPDEVWTTLEGKMIQVQDLEPEHCRNIVRMILRQQRENAVAYQELVKEIGSLIESIEGTDDMPVATTPTPTPLLPDSEFLLTTDGPAPGQLLN